MEKALIFLWPEGEGPLAPPDAPSPFPPEPASVYTQRCRLQSRQGR